MLCESHVGFVGTYDSGRSGARREDSQLGNWRRNVGEVCLPGTPVDCVLANVACHQRCEVRAACVCLFIDLCGTSSGGVAALLCDAQRWLAHACVP